MIDKNIVVDETQKEELYIKNIFGVKDYFYVDVIMKTIDEKTIIIRSWNGLLKKLKFDEKEKCYEVVREENDGRGRR